MNLESNQKKGRRERGKSADVAAIAIFLSFLLVFPLLSFVRGDRAFSENENRALAQTPEMTVQRVLNGSFEQDFEAYVQDQIMGRDTMMAWKTAGDRLIGRKDNGNVYFGKKDMLFPIEEIDWKQLSRNIDAASALQQHFEREYGIALTALIAPTAAEVERENLPEHAPVPDQKEAIRLIRERFSGTFCDTQEILSLHRREYIYYRSDHHWTTLGAYYAYRHYQEEILSEKGILDLRQIRTPEEDGFRVTVQGTDFLGTSYSKAPGRTSSKDEIFTIEKDAASENWTDRVTMRIFDAALQCIDERSSLYDEEYLGKKDQYAYFLSGNHPVLVIDKNEESEQGRCLLVIRDSFANCFIPFLVSDFDRIVAVDPRYYRKSLDPLIQEYHVTDALLLYNIMNFSSDKNLLFVSK